LSQIVNYGDTEVEKRAIFCRHLARQIRVTETTPEVDLSEVELVRIAQHNTGTRNLDLTGGEGERPGLRPTTGAGSGKARDPKMKLLDEIIDELNRRFAGEGFREHQERSWIKALLGALLEDEDIVRQAAANSEEQFLSSPTLRDSVMIAVDETHGAHARMTELFQGREDVERNLTPLLGRLLYLELQDRVG